MTGIVTNQVFESTTKGSLLRVLWVDPTLAYTIDIKARTVSPVSWTIFEIRAKLKEGFWRLADDPFKPALDSARIAAVHRATADKRWELILPLLRDQPQIFEKNYLKRAAAKLAALTGVPKKTLLRWLRRCWQRALGPDSLIPDYAHCGGHGLDKAVSAKKRGRRSKTSQHINITPEICSMIRTVIRQHYMPNRHMTVATAYDEFIKSYFTSYTIDERTGEQLPDPPKNVPSPWAFRYWVRKMFSSSELERAHAPRVYKRDNRAILGSSTAETIGPGSRFQIDATVFDAHLLSRYDRTKIAGRVVVWLVIDVFSRMIVGVYAGFEGESWLGAAMALTNTIADKVGFCKRYDISIPETKWPCHHFPSMLLGDRGALASTSIEALMKRCDVHIETTAPYRADLKGIVERALGLLTKTLKPYLPGAVDKGATKRGAPDSRLEARLDIWQFNRALLRCVIEYNNHHIVRRYEKSPAMYRDKVRAIPVELWNWGIVNLSGSLRSFPEEWVRLNLLPTDKATATREGLRYDGLFYTCEKAMAERWFERSEAGWKVWVSYDPRCMDQIYVHDEANLSKFYVAVLTEKCRHHRGKTQREIHDIRKKDRELDALHAPRARQARIESIGFYEANNAEAEAMYPKPSGESKRSRTRGIRATHEAEKLREQQKNAFRASGTGQPPALKDEFEDDYSPPDITELLQSGKEEDDAGT